jgi:F-type H+-transporting ATPase subunit b
MEILSALGVNWTIWIQLGCFVVAYLALSQLIFKPYLAALHERNQRTIGNEEYADRVIEETHQLQGRYEERAREINQQYKSIYDRSRVEATREHDQIVLRARQEAMKLIEQNRIAIEKEVRAAKDELSQQVPVVGLAIASKLVGKELAQ